MNDVLPAGLMVGIVLLIYVKRRIAGWSRVRSRLALVLVACYGALPQALLQFRLVEMSTVGAVLAIVYFVLFSVIGLVMLNGILIRGGKM